MLNSSSHSRMQSFPLILSKSPLPSSHRKRRFIATTSLAHLPPDVPSSTHQFDDIRNLFIKSRQKKKRGTIDTYRGNVGLPAKVNFYKSFKRLDRLTQQNKFSHLEDSPDLAYLQVINNKRMKPEPIGLVKRKGNPDVIDLNGYYIGDDFALALSSSLPHLHSIERLNLNSNRLTDIGSGEILKNVDP